MATIKIYKFKLSRTEYETAKLSGNDIEQLLWTASDLKIRIKKSQELFKILDGKSVIMLFQKKSTRTRLSIETGCNHLGAYPIFLGRDDIHLGVNETLKDSAKVFSRMSDAIVARVFDQKDLETLAEEADIPVINALSDFTHPLQILADYLTLQEHFGYLQGLNLAWIGDGNNILHSLLYSAPKMGINISFATPKNYKPNEDVVKESQNLAQQNGTKVLYTEDPIEAIQNAQIIVTDTWISMGQESEKSQRLKDFKGYQIDSNMVKYAAKDWVFLHCLPRKQEEVTDEIFYDKKSLVWNEAENRKWTFMAVLVHLLRSYAPRTFKPMFKRI